jgi:predicted nucleic acid-binding protein
VVRLFVDTSAILALLNADDSEHRNAHSHWMRWIEAGASFETHNYLVVESHALVQSRLGMDAVDGLESAILPLLTVHWVDLPLHQAAVQLLLGANRRTLSLVDCTSFVLMGQTGIDTAFAFDQHFAEQGFRLWPTYQEKL